jgi:uncharacterized membrane protein YfcA
MIAYIAIAVIASLFYYIGNHEYYDKGWLLAAASVVCSFVAAWVLPFAFIDILIGNVALYVGVLVYNLVSKRPPGGRSGF